MVPSAGSTEKGHGMGPCFGSMGSREPRPFAVTARVRAKFALLGFLALSSNPNRKGSEVPDGFFTSKVYVRAWNMAVVAKWMLVVSHSYRAASALAVHSRSCLASEPPATSCSGSATSASTDGIPPRRKVGTPPFTSSSVAGRVARRPCTHLTSPRGCPGLYLIRQVVSVTGTWSSEAFSVAKKLAVTERLCPGSRWPRNGDTLKGDPPAFVPPCT
mmetsp:Transcript_32242/g.72755  ORF Transcript_32242/g.72755 Transcript_32242/m.72755 type:complete len:216 (-) Transcript_32242:6-653(-)